MRYLQADYERRLDGISAEVGLRVAKMLGKRHLVRRVIPSLSSDAPSPFVLHQKVAAKSAEMPSTSTERPFLPCGCLRPGQFY